MLAISLTACGGGSSPTSQSTIQEPTEPVPVEPIVDHSGLTPLSKDLVDEHEYLAGGDATVFVSDEDAFSTSPDMIDDDIKFAGFFNAGDHLFRTSEQDIGPLLSTGNCQGCHVNDGRGSVPETPSSPMLSMLFKLGDNTGAADPIYGDQLQPFAVQVFQPQILLRALLYTMVQLTVLNFMVKPFLLLNMKPSMVLTPMVKAINYNNLYIR